MKRFILILFTILTIIACNNGSEIKDISFNLNIIDKELINDSNIFKVEHKDFVNLKITTNKDLKIHIHGYDIEKEITTDEPALIEFQAKATGRFNITIHPDEDNHSSHSHSKSDSNEDEEKQLAVLEVMPK